MVVATAFGAQSARMKEAFPGPAEPLGTRFEEKLSKTLNVGLKMVCNRKYIA